jgi:predicted nucleic acid-binding protein
MTYVVDASVALKWIVPEVLSDHADRLLDGNDDLLAPDLVLTEAANALWKKTAARELSSAEADRALATLITSGLALHATVPLLPRALRFAHRLRHPVYDCVYLALAEREDARLVTADARLLARAGRRRGRAQVVDLRSF